MTRYFWPETDLTKERQTRLMRAGIRFTPHFAKAWAGLLRTEKGFILTAEDHAASLKRLGARVIQEKTDPDPRRVSLVFDAPVEHCVHVCCWSDNQLEKQAYADIASAILAPVLNYDIVIHGTAGEYGAPKGAASDFELHLWSSPLEGARPSVKAPHSLWGIPVLEPKKMFSPSGMGKVIYDSSDIPIGEIVGRHAYLFLRVTHSSDDASLKLFECFCHALLNTMMQGGLKPLDIKDAVYRDRRQQYAEICLGRVTHELETKRKRLAQLAVEIHGAEVHLRKLIDEDRYLRAEIPLLSEHSENVTGRYESEYDKLCSNRKIRTAYIAENVLVVHTDVLYWQHPKTLDYYEFGAMQIEIQLSEDAEVILSFQNLTRRVKGIKEDMHHPHVCDTGQPCWGGNDTRLTFVKLVARKELALAVSFAIQFIETVNLKDSWGKAFHNWPTVPPEEVRRLQDCGILPIPRKPKGDA